jgi:hypothetical protein
MKFNSFDGSFDIHGTEREIAFVPAADGELSVLAIRGLSIEDALHVLSALNGGLLKGKDAEQLPLRLGQRKTETKPAAPASPPKAESKPATKPAPAINVVHQLEPEDADAEDEEDDEDTELTDDVIKAGDIAAMAKMEKLRPVIEHLVSLGFKSAAAITSISESIKGNVPALMEVDKKGDFGKRMERAAMVVLGAA